MLDFLEVVGQLPVPVDHGIGAASCLQQRVVHHLGQLSRAQLLPFPRSALQQLIIILRQIRVGRVFREIVHLALLAVGVGLVEVGAEVGGVDVGQPARVGALVVEVVGVVFLLQPLFVVGEFPADLLVSDLADADLLGDFGAEVEFL